MTYDIGPAVGRVWPRRREQVYERDGRVCARCGATERLQIDHKFPRVRGGDASMENLQVLCRSCNIAKADRTMEEWLAALAEASA